MSLTVIETSERIRDGSLRAALVSGVENLLVPIDLFSKNPEAERERRIAINLALENGQNYDAQSVEINEKEYVYYELVGGQD